MQSLELLEKIGTLKLISGTDFAITKQVAEFFEVPKKTIETTIRENENEIKIFYAKKIQKEELKELKKTTKELKHIPETWTFKAKTILKLAFLLTNSEKAKQLRQEVFNYDKELYSELSHTTSLRSKKKEEFCFENIKINFPQVKIERQKKIKNYSVDFCLNDTFYLEIDEYGHSGYNNQNETKRTETIEKEIGKKLIRFNPDKQQPFELICTIAEVLKCKN